LLRRDSREIWERKGSKTALDLARERVRELLAKHQPRELDPAVEREMLQYRDMARERTMADFEAAEWED
jgi:trimethylamine:corrinoid methyltransferase-like protein